MKNRTCTCCGGAAHSQGEKCRADGKICGKCNKPNHFAAVCRSRTRNVQRVSDNTESDSEDEIIERIIEVKKLNSESITARMKVRNYSDGKEADKSILLATDTGVRKTILNKTDWDSIKAKCKLVKTSKGFRPYGCSAYRLPIIGRSYVNLTAERGASTKTWVYIVNSHSESSLLGESDAIKLGIVKIDLKGSMEEVRKVEYLRKETHQDGDIVSGGQTQQEIDETMNQIKAKFTLFSNTTGKFKGPPLPIQFDETAKPVKQPRRKIPLHYVDRLQDELRKMVAEDVIEGPLTEEEKGTFISNLVIADKKNSDRIRVTLDCQAVNKHIYATHEPIPTIEELRHKFKGSDRFSKVDLTNCYHQFEIDESARKLFAFQTPWGIYRFKRMVMGTSPASSEVQKRIRETVQNCQNVVHIKDDIVIHGKGTEHDKFLEELLNILQVNGATLRPEKCELGKDAIAWFGNIFSKQGMSPDPEKCKVIKEWKPPTSKAEVKSFLQTVQFNSKFLNGKAGELSYPELTQPLRALTKKNARFVWNEKEDSAFVELKKRLCSDSVIAPFDNALETRLYVDASPVGTQATVAQGHIIDGKTCWRPVNHTSRAWTAPESGYSQIERESNGIVTGMHMNRMYTTGTHVEVVTDHEPLLPIYNDLDMSHNLRVDNHRSKLLSFDYHLCYEPGKTTPCDYGSRHPAGNTLFTHKQLEEWCIEDGSDIYVNRIVDDLVPRAVPLKILQQETEKDETLQALKHDVLYQKKCRPDLKSFKGVFKELSIINGLILRGEKIIIPQALQSEVIGLSHESHLGMEKTLRLLRESCWFPNMYSMTEEYCRTCLGCQAATTTTAPVPLQPNFLPERAWQKLHADFKGPIGEKYYLHVIIDQFSKFPEVDIVSSTRFEKLQPCLDRIFATHGIPEEISCDGGPPYQSHEMEKYAEEMGIKMNPVTPEDPNCNGFAENFVKVLCKLIHTCTVEGKDPRRELHKFLLQYRATPHLTTGRSPAEMLFNRKIRTKLPFYHKRAESVSEKRTREIHDKKKLKQKENYDRRRQAKLKDVQVGDQILVRQKKSTINPPFRPQPLIVSEVKGNQVTASDEQIKRKRDKNHIKVVPRRPIHLKPSWETPRNSEHTQFASFDFDSRTPHMAELEQVNPTHEEVATPQQDSAESLFSLQPDMTADLERLIQNAQSSLQDRNQDSGGDGNNSGDSDKRVTRSRGMKLAWNPEMSTKIHNVLLPAEGDNDITL